MVQARQDKPCLWMVVPCYNESAVLPQTAPMFLAELKKLIADGLVSTKSKICFVDDGSKDDTWSIITKLAQANSAFAGVRQSRNRGHQNAVFAGLMTARNYADITISIDCDGQDDISVMHDMLAAYNQGSEVVYGVRSDRGTDSAFKRYTAQGFYKFMEQLGVETVYNHADYRLLSAPVLNALVEFGEVNLFLRGMIPLIGYKSSEVFYKRSERLAGESHYPFTKMLHLAFEGITSLSVKPLHIITLLGIGIAFLSLLGIAWSLFSYFNHTSIVGWTSLASILLFLGGVQILSIGIIGEYVGKIYLETKARPRYIISEDIGIE